MMTFVTRSIALLGTVAAVALSLVAPANLFAQEPAPRVEDRLSDPVFMAWVRHKDLESCLNCHYLPNIAQIAGGQQTAGTFVRLRELNEWLSSDKHTIARRRVEPIREDQTEAELERLVSQLDAAAKALANDFRQRGIAVDEDQLGLEEFPREWIGQSNYLSRRICDKLEYDVNTEAGYAKFRDNCLTCHGGYQHGTSGFDSADSPDAQIGISCLYCHQNGDNTQWIGDHWGPRAEQVNWRLMPPEEKEAAGMRNLVQTSRQADLCFDCHVGNRSKGMFVTHEMYAAGHPPIPSIELETFCRQMPQHWQSPSQLHQSLDGYPQRDQYFQINYPGVVSDQTSPDKVFWNTRKMLLGALSARKKAVQLYADSASEPESWADYSLYDCAACHHELRVPSLRQLRGYPGAPGRPRQHEWPDALLKILYDESTLASSQQTEQQLLGHFSSHPFGNPSQVGPASTMLAKQLDAAIANIESKPVTATVARRLLTKLAQASSDRLLTYDSARQVVWAMNVIVDEMQSANETMDAQVVQKVRSLGSPDVSGIETTLPAGRSKFIYPQSLAADLERRANYRPQQLKAQLDQIRQLLASRPREASTLVRTPRQ